MGAWFGYHWVDLDTDLSEIGLSKRAHRFLRRHQVKKIQDLLAHGDRIQDLADRTHGVGPKTVEEVSGVVLELSLKFGKGVIAVLSVMTA